MAADTWLLMTLYWKIDRREAVGQSLWRALAYVAGLVFMLFVAAASAAFGLFISFLTQPESPVIMPPGLVPGMLLTMVLVGVLVVGMNQAVKALFLSGDLDRLMVAPVHTRSVMVAKLLSRFPSNLLLLFLIAAPAIIAYGIGIGAGPVYFILGVILLLLAPLFGLSVGAIIAMLLVRVLPVNRLSELLTASYALLGIIIALLAQLAPRSLDQGDPEQMLESMSGAGINAAIDTLSRAPLPSFWAGRGLVALDAGQADVTGLLGIIAYVLLTLGLFAFIILTADKLYLSGWLKTQGAGGKRRGLESSGGRFGRGSLAGAIALKDWLLRLRDPRQLVSLVGSGFVAIVVGALAIFRGSGGEDSLLTLSTQGDPLPPGPLAALAAGFSPGVLIATWALFVGYVFLANTATYALPLEGLSFPLLKAAPISPRAVWSAKLWSVYWPFVVLFILALAGSWFVVRYSLFWFPYATAVGLLMGFGLLATCVSTGFRFANLSWTDPRKMVTSGGGLVSLLLSVAFGVPAMVIALLGFSLHAMWPGWAIPLALLAVVVLGLLTWGWHRLMLAWADRSWDKLPV